MDLMTSSYNLIDMPWIPVLTHSGVEKEVGIEELLRNAASFHSLAAELSTVNFALLRVLLAILYRAWDSPRWRSSEHAVEHWEEKWNQDSLFDAEIRTYLETWHARFDLRDDEHPFYQAPDLRTSKDGWKELALILPDVGHDDLFTMRTSSETMTAAEAARMLIHCMAYDYSGIKSGAVGDPRVKGGRGFPIGIGWCGWMGGTVIEGANLRETLLLNYLPYRDQAGTADLPLWEMEPLTAAPRNGARFDHRNPERTRATGQVELLTWPQRRLRLRWSEDHAVAVLIANGDPVGYTSQHGAETMTAWRFSDPQTKKAKQPIYMPKALDPNRPIWTSLGGILPDVARPAKSKFGENLKAEEPPESVKWISRLIDDAVLPGHYQIQVRVVSMVYGAKSSSFKSLSEDSITLKSPMLALEGQNRRAAAQQAVSDTEAVAMKLGTFFRELFYAASGEDQVDSSVIRGQFYSDVDPMFRRWIFDLGDTDAPLGALSDWRRDLEIRALRLAAEAISDQGPSVWIGRWNPDYNRRITGATAERRLRYDLRRLLQPAETQDSALAAESVSGDPSL